MNGNKPKEEFRIGMVRASIWENVTGDSTRYSVKVSRIYRENDEWKRTESFGRDDLLPLAKVLDRAHTWICDQRTSK